jgi:alpha-D-ribose 1-methylphosphonate 5-triphosphate synthase subunit PhnH
MNQRDLSALGAGFGNEALASQAVFRSALHALSHPGRLVDITHDAQLPAQGHSASAALLLAMLDADCTLWLSPTLAASDAAMWLHFHTGCQLVSDAAMAQFVWLAQGDAMPALASLAQGTEAYPDHSAICVLDVAELGADTHHGNAWTLQGPGIQTHTSVGVQGLASDFAQQWAANHARFPRGVDVFLAAQHRLLGLPRTTAIVQNKGTRECT